MKPGGSHSERQATVFSPSAWADDLAFGARLQLVFGRCRAGIQLGELEALEQLPLLVQQQRLQRQAGVAVQVQLEAVAMLVARSHRKDHCRAAGDTGFADQAQVVPGSQLGGIELAHRPQLGIGQLVGKAAADALGAPVDPDHFLARAVELEQALANRTIALHAMPDLMGGEAAIALVDEGALETVLAIGLGETIQPVGSVGSLSGGNRHQAAKQKQQGGGAHVSPQRFSRLAARA